MKAGARPPCTLSLSPRGERTRLQRSRPTPSPHPHSLANGGKLAKASLRGEGWGEGGLNTYAGFKLILPGTVRGSRVGRRGRKNRRAHTPCRALRLRQGRADFGRAPGSGG